jgi:hypothetical protein
VHEPFGVPVYQDVKGLNRAGLKLLHQIFVAHLLKRIVPAGSRPLPFFGLANDFGI